MASGDKWHIPGFAKGKEFSMFLRHRCRFSELRNLCVTLPLWDWSKSLNLSYPQFPPVWNENLYSSLAKQIRDGHGGARGSSAMQWLGITHVCPSSPFWFTIQHSHTALTSIHEQRSLFATPSPPGWVSASIRCPDRGGSDHYCLDDFFPKGRYSGCQLLSPDLALLARACLPALAEHNTPHLGDFWPFPNVSLLVASVLSKSFILMFGPNRET